ncbi:MAG: aspartate 1-decarboxylase [Deltaproteobacteria bacterium]|nr:aspartate 1-decarboxylase [Deltaproteobacteria bacterium]
MQRIMLKSKIHRATVTDANIDYEGSISIDESLMQAAGILPFEQVHIYNISNGNRFQTYAIKGARGSGEICINGAAAHLAKRGHIIIIASYAGMEETEAADHMPALVYVNNKNQMVAPAEDKIGAKIKAGIW